MEIRHRIYEAVLREHLAKHRQMAFVSGPRQVGKSTTCRAAGTHYLDWDLESDRRLIGGGQDALAQYCGLSELLGKGPPVLVLDEFHKFPR